MIEEETGSVESPLARLEKQEKDLWHAMEREIKNHAMKVAQRDAVKGAMPLLDAVEEFRESARVIADGIRQLTAIIRAEILIQEETLAVSLTVEDLAAKVDATLKERIEFHFRPHELPNTPK